MSYINPHEDQDENYMGSESEWAEEEESNRWFENYRIEEELEDEENGLMSM